MTSFLFAFWLTAYSYGCDCKPGNPTKSGIQPLSEWTVAADPKVLPLGSIVEIEGVGVRMVHDIGGKVRGLHLDLFMDNCREARKWGRQKRLVRVLHRPSR